MVTIENLSKNFGKKIVLKNINLTLDKGKIYGVVGVNGSGKSTFFNCIAGLHRFSGKITATIPELKNKIGFLPTEPYLFSKITGKEYLELLLLSRGDQVTNIERKNIFELPLQQYASTYSTGMKKKLALTAILLQKNDFYILDEPFNGVDIQSNQIITEIILKLKSLGKTVILSSHIFSTLTDTCDYMLVLENGQINTIVNKLDFKTLESDMKAYSIQNKIELLELQ